MHTGFMRQQADIKREYRDKINAQRKKLRGAVGADKNQIRNRLAELRGGKRSATRGHAARWSKKFGASPRIGINVGYRNGRRVIQGLSFRRQRGGQQAHLDRARKRYMRIAERFRGQKLDARFYGRPDKAGINMAAARRPQNQVSVARRGAPPNVQQGGGQQGGGMGGGWGKYAYAPTHADFSRGGRLRGSIQVGDHWRTGRYGGHTVQRFGRRPMNEQERWFAQGKHAPFARHNLRGDNQGRWRMARNRYPVIGTGRPNFSDSRLKTDIEAVGKSPSGINIYQFRYVGGGPLYRGVLAQELLDTHPDAVVTMPNGYYGVRYDLIDVDFVKVSGKELVSSA